MSPSTEYRERYFDFTWDAMVWNGETYGYPISVESLGLIYNKDIVQTAPESFEALAELDAELSEEGKKAILFDYGEPYYGWPLLAANGGYPYKRTAEGYDVGDIGVNNAGAVEGAQRLRELIDSGVLPEGTDYNVMASRFNRGEVATMISGPWAWSNLEKSGIDFGVAPLPKVGEKRAKPLFGVTAAMINAASPNDFLATEFLEGYLLDEEGLRTFNSDGSLGAVAHRAYQAELGENPNIAATLANAEIGDPMPNIPEMGAFWSAMEPALVVSLLWLVVAFHLRGQWMFALLFLVLGASLAVVFGKRELMSHRYVFPALAGMGVFVIFPLLYTVGISFSNYSSSNLLSEERVRAQFLERTYQAEGSAFDFRLYREGERVRLYLEAQGEETSIGASRLISEPLVDSESGGSLAVHPAQSPPAGEVLGMREVIAERERLQRLVLTTPEGVELRMAGLRHFAPILPRYTENPDGSLTDLRDGTRLTPDREHGFFVDGEGERLTPGWPVAVGLDNYARVLLDPDVRGPFLAIFVWTFVFAGLTVLFTLAVGFVLASLLQWEQLRGKAVYRTLLILPYAVPAFISILIFKGMFNQSYGEINLILEGLFGIRPNWFTDPAMARTMLLIVNTWLGYPYMLLLCMGLLQSVPRDLYEASAVDGGGPLTNMFRITLPLIIKPLTPLLIAAFAFNFNNFVLITLLTGGSPDILGASTPAGTTDLLVSYTYRIAFQDAGQDFGLAAAIATLIFLLVMGLSLLNLRLSRVEV